MSGVRVLVGTAKARSSSRRTESASGGRSRPPFRGLGNLSPQGIARRPEPAVRVPVQRLVRAADPALRRRRRDLGAGRQQVRVRRRPRHAPVVRRHAAPLGVQAGLASRAVADRSRTRSTPGWRTPPCSARPTAAGAGRSCPGCAATARVLAGSRAPAGCACTRSSSTRAIPARIFIAISAAGAFRTDDGGKTWRPINRGLRSQYIPDPDAEVGHCVHRIAMHPSRPDVLFMQKHWDVMRSDDAGDSWQEVSGNLPTDFGFPIDVHAHEPETIYVVPIKSDSEHFPPDGQAARLPQPDGRQRVGGAHEGPAAERLLRQRAARRDGGGLARLVRRVLRHDRRPGVRLGRRRRQLGAHRPGPSAGPVRRGPDAAMIRVVLPPICGRWRGSAARCS